jgi:pimeloyl-ACP methyl ester carboxylesterase
MHSPISSFALNQSVRLHTLTFDTNNAQTAILLLPGMTETAERYADLIEQHKIDIPHNVVIMSNRGRGQSDAPKEGYSLKHHASDIDTVIRTVIPAEQNICILAFSQSVTYTLYYATQMQMASNIKGIIVCDYPSISGKISNAWIQAVLERKSLQKHVALGLAEESEQFNFIPFLSSLQIPLKAIKAEEQSLLPEEYAKLYQDHCPQGSYTILSQSNHDIFGSSPKSFIEALNTFISENAQ